MTTPLLQLESLVKRFGGLTATDHASLSVMTGEVHALIGPNGAGKTTLIHQISGAMASDEGTLRFNGVDITHMPMHERVLAGLARSYQITSIFRRLSVLDNVALATQPKLLLLDEPMAGMGPDESEKMVHLLLSLRGETTILLVEHDMGAVFRLADRISTLVFGKVIASGTPEEIRNHPEVRRAYLGDEEHEGAPA